VGPGGGDGPLIELHIVKNMSESTYMMMWKMISFNVVEFDLLKAWPPLVFWEYTILSIFITRIKAIVEKVAQRFLANFAFVVLIDLISKFSRLRKTGGKIVGGEEADPYSIPYQVKQI
jgi:hypothetical protein